MNASHPIDRIEWRPAASLLANDYNPNVVFDLELNALEQSLLLTGWVQPVLITPDGTIIDGFHRRMLAMESPSLRARDGGLVPCAVLDIPRAEAMIVTIRMNRAKGSHVALKMADMVQELIDTHQLAPPAIAKGIGATLQEIDLLYQNNVFKARDLDNYRYSEAWTVEPVARAERVEANRSEKRQKRLARRLVRR